MSPISSLLLCLLLEGAKEVLGKPSLSTGIEAGDYLVISNASVPCTEFDGVMSTLGQKQVYTLKDHHKLQLFQSLGGTWDPSLQAIDEKRAADSFRNLLPISASDLAALKKYSADESLHLKESIVRGLVNMKYEGDLSGETSTPTPLAVELVDTYSVIDEGTESEIIEYCLSRGLPISRDPNYLRLCSVCAATRTMRSDFWPRYINEALCSTTEPNCLIGEDDKAHGQCQPVILPLNILRRQPGKCTMALANGQVVIAENWELITDIIQVGCDCAVSRNSFFARYA